MGEVKTYTYYQLYREVNKLAKALKDFGVKKGDRVAVFLPVIPELPITLLATARIGGVHTVVFSGFSAEALADRVNDCGAKILVTADGSFRRGKPIGIKDNADRAIPLMPNIEKVIVVKRTGQPVQMKEGRDVWYHDALSKRRSKRLRGTRKHEINRPTVHPLHFRNHRQTQRCSAWNRRISCLGLLDAKWAFNPTDEDIYWCVADIGWITGHTYNVYAPLSLGITAFFSKAHLTTQHKTAGGT